MRTAASSVGQASRLTLTSKIMETGGTPVLLQSARLTGAFQNFLRQRGGFGRAVFQNAVAVGQVRHQLGAPGPRGGKMLPINFKQFLLQIAVAEAAGAQLFL